MPFIKSIDNQWFANESLARLLPINGIAADLAQMRAKATKRRSLASRVEGEQRSLCYLVWLKDLVCVAAGREDDANLH